MDSASPFSLASKASSKALSKSVTMVSTYFVSSRLCILSLSTSAIMATPSFMVTAKGWAPPIPPRPAVKTNFPLRDPPKCVLATEARVSNVPWRIPWVPMYIQLPAVIWPNIVSPLASNLRNSSQVAHLGTIKALAIKTRGASG